jgi:hypothetical protein
MCIPPVEAPLRGELSYVADGAVVAALGIDQYLIIEEGRGFWGGYVDVCCETVV